MEKESHLLEELEKLSLSGPRGSRERPHTSRCFTPLLDIPVDGYHADSPVHKPSSDPAVPNWLLTRSDTTCPPLRTDIGTIRSVHFDEVSLLSTSDQRDTDGARPPFRNGLSQDRKAGSGSTETVFTLHSATRRSRPSLLQVFNSPGDNGHRASSENGLNGSDPQEEYELQTVTISKTKQSLGK